MSSKGNILLIDNVNTIRRTYKRLLEFEGYTVFTASHPNEARSILESKRVDLMIIDVRLSDDNDSMDKSGIIFANSIDQGIQKIMLTAYFQHEYYDLGPPNVKYVLKQQGPEVLLNEVKKVFLYNISSPLQIEFHKSVSISQFVTQIKQFKSLSDQKLREIEQELEQLLRQLFRDANRIKIRYLAPGRGGSGVMFVRPYYKDIEGASVVVKFGAVNQIEREVRNYEEFVGRFVRGNSTQLIKAIQTKNLAAAVYLFVGTALGKSTDFNKVYKDESFSNENIARIIHNLFFDSCQLWYNAKRDWNQERDYYDLVSSYKKQLSLHKPSDWQELQVSLELLLNRKRFKGVTLARESNKHINLLLPNGQQAQQLLDPVRFVARFVDQFPNPLFWCMTHGDLNGRNMFVDRDKNVWLIDFYRTGWGPALRDAAELETVIKFELLQTNNLSDLISFENSLLSPTHFDQSIELASRLADDPDFKRALETIKAIRAAAAKISGIDSIPQYYTGLLFYALKMLTWKGVSSVDEERKPIRQRHALYSAAKICEKLYQITHPSDDDDVVNIDDVT